MAAGKRWTERELLVALHLYCRLPFGRMHRRNPEIIHFAELLGRTSSSLAMKLVNLAHIDPHLQRKGLSNASVGDHAAWQKMEADWERFARESRVEVQRLLQQEPAGPRRGVDADTELWQIRDEEVDWTTLPAGGEREQLVRVRQGQQFFRNAVLSAHNRRCCISGLSVEFLLEASHIVPWRQDEVNRLNPRNGLALSALHHRAFDAGLITIDEGLRVCVSEKVQPADDDYFYAGALKRYHGQQIITPEKFMPRQDFLSRHRETVFEQRAP